MKSRIGAATVVLLLVVTAALVGTADPAASAAARTYPAHTGIVSTTFWVGEIFDANASDGSQVCSTYDDQWARNWSGVDNGAKAGSGTACSGAALGGCDGSPAGTGANFVCATERRSSGNGYFPNSVGVHPLQNPFYLDLPFDDLNNNAAYAARGTVVPWANDPGYAGNVTNQGFSYMKNRWVRLSKGTATCYAQVEDAGPGQYNDQAYVFGAADARPANREFNGAGLDVSPAVNGCLGFAELDGDSDQVGWSWVEAAAVPAGPWTRVVTYSQVDGAAPSPAYRANITPGGGAVTTTTSPTTPIGISTSPTSRTATPTSAGTTPGTTPPTTTASTTPTVTRGDGDGGHCGRHPRHRC
jgi:hypothetical protein